jgi:hypothetical protein
VRELMFSRKELFQRQRLPLLFRISDFDHDIEVDDGFQELSNS